ncbi:MAG: CBS domain-containing protein [Rhodospirillaceae bacterium]|nr:CBS domain-containing protein [Rhodospirillaceae bacterium]
MTRTIGDIMATKLLTFTPETSIHKAIHLLLEKRFSGAPVLDTDGNLVGVLSKKDCLKIVFSTGYHHDHGGQVREYMSKNVETLNADTDLVEAAEYFIKSHFRRFPVVQDGKLVGQISRHDILRALIEESATAKLKPV